MKQIKALLSLIDDNDRVIRAEVLAKFRTLGLEGRNKIVNYISKSENEELIVSGEQLLNDLSDYYIKEQLKIFIDRKKSFEFYFLVSLAFNAYISSSTFEVFFKKIVVLCQKKMDSSYTTRQKLVVISQVLFREQQFRNVQLEIKNAMYLNLDSVISNKKGETLSLCIIYKDIASSLGINLDFCVFKDYFMLRLPERNELYIDLSGNGNLLSMEEVKLLLKINYIHFNKRKILNTNEMYKTYLDKLILFLSESDSEEISNRLEFFKEELFF